MKRRNYIRYAGLGISGIAGCSGSQTGGETQASTEQSGLLPPDRIRQNKLRTFLDFLENDLRYDVEVKTLIIIENQGLLGPDHIVKLEYITTQQDVPDFQAEQAAIAMGYKIMVNFDNWDVGRLDVRTYDSKQAARRRKPAVTWSVESEWVEDYVEGTISREQFIENVLLSVGRTESTPNYESSLPTETDGQRSTFQESPTDADADVSTDQDTVTEQDTDTPTETKEQADIPSIDWTRQYQDSLIQSAITTKDGGYLLAGFTRSSDRGDLGLLIKTNSNGIRRWRKHYGGDEQDRIHSVVQTMDGGYAFAGETMSAGPPQQNAWLVKVDAHGNTVWEATFGGDKADWGYDLIQTKAGNYLVVGTTNSFDSAKQGWLIETDTSGAEISSWTYGGERSQSAQALVSTGDGGLAFAGKTLPDDPVNGNQGWLVKLDQGKSEMWSQALGGSEDDFLLDVIQTSDGGFALAGTTRSDNTGGRNAWLVKTGASGVEQWSKNFGGDSQDRGYSVREFKQGGFLLSGQTMSFGQHARNAWLISLDSEGNKRWRNTYGNQVGNNFPEIIDVKDTSIVVAGSSGLLRLIR